MANKEQVIIEMLAEIDGYVKDMKKAREESDKTRGGIELDFKKIAKSAGSMAKDSAIAVATFTAAVATMIVQTAKGRQELSQLSRQAKMTSSDFESLSFATRQYGINAEQIADISKDIADRLGEFATDGKGVFNDFVNVVGLGKDEAMALAKEMENLSSDQIIGRMIKMMEDAGATTNQMTFALESMGNDLSKLIPLFSNNSAELNRLEDAYKKVNTQLNINQEEAKELTKAAESFDLMTTAISKSAQEISASLSPAFTKFFNYVSEVVPVATNQLLAFFGILDETPTLNNKIRDFNMQISEAESQLERMENGLKSVKATASVTGLFGFGREEDISNRQKAIDDQKLYIENLKQMLSVATETRDNLGGGVLVGGAGSKLNGGAGGENTSDQALSKENDTNQQIFDMRQEWIDAEIQQQSDKDAVLLDFNASFNQIVRDDAENTYKFVKSVRDKDLSEEKKRQVMKLNAAREGIRGAMALSNLFFEDNKALNAGLIVADTAVGVMAALKKQDYAGAALTAATGAAMYQQNESASKGGGSISGGAGASAPTEPQQEPQTTVDVSVTEFTDSGTITGRETVSGGSNFENMFSDFLEDQKRNGNLNGSLA